MAIVQISKIQQRAGNLVDLPQLDNAEFGWATDTNRLFIGRTGNAYTDENIEVLTSYSDISFSQINGSDGGNFNITAAQNGQILAYVSSTDTWENYSGNTSQFDGDKLQLGNVSNISMTGGAIGYVLETDGTGNLSWAPKGTLYSPVISLSNATPIIMTVANTTPYVNGTSITITNVNGVANANVNGLTFYLTLANDFASSGNVELYTDIARTTGANGTGLTYTNSPNAIATSSVGIGGGSGGVGSTTNTQVIFNELNLACGSPSFTFNSVSSTLTVGNNINTANLNASASITALTVTSNIATGTAPFTVSSTTLVPNLFVARANVSEYANTALTTTGTWYPIFVNATSGNLAQGANANLSFNAATGALSATLLTGTLTTAAQPNITSTGTLTSLTVTGNVTAGNLVGPHANGNSNITITQNANITFTSKSNSTMVISDTGANITGTANISGNANVGNLGTSGNINAGNLVGPLANGNSNISITSNANITLYVAGNATARLTATTTGIVANGTISVSGNANVGNLGTAQVLATANITSPQLISNVATGTAPLVVTSTTRVSNLNVNYANVSDFGAVTTQTTGIFYPVFVNGNTTANYAHASNANLTFNASTGALGATLFTGTLSTASQPNVTSLGTLSTLGVNGTITAVNITANTGIFTGNGSGLTAIAGANVTGTVSQATTVMGATQNNITTLGALTTLSSGSNITVGTITGNWGLSAGSKLTATYADLAEYYEADKPYEPGTVVEFGGEKEVTIAEDGTTRVAGVVSTNPAYVMNSTCKGEHIVALALQGRVPVKARGTIRKGDMLVSGGEGYARPMIHPYIGSVIGKSLENFEGEGVIEVAVGRL